MLGYQSKLKIYSTVDSIDALMKSFKRVWEEIFVASQTRFIARHVELVQKAIL
jgi:hypothetical protein